MALLEYNETEKIVAGCDEAGRGCLAGPVVAAAVILPKGFIHPLLNDSKKLSQTKRDALRKIIEAEAIDYAVAMVDVQTIDSINILNASILAMHHALAKLKTTPGFIIVDGNRFKPYKNIAHQSIVKGDGKYTAIAAASILAKTHRDEHMLLLHNDYPQYKWDKNMSYATAAHVAAIREFGYTQHHRKSFHLKAFQLSIFQ
ncbi:MAG: ribonuclease HII [Bacteroidetes bacterium]|nr:ribonuclease HII [Bacteroidota bacterium]